MTNFKLNLPVDIPWERRCVSADMIDAHLCDTTSPPRWRSSIAIFQYEPDKENQNYEGMTISYLKVACTITGYQEDPNEIGTDRRGLRSYWKGQPGIENYLDVLQKYYACYGAVLEVTVGPASPTSVLDDYPYFADFEPKKRELYELATDTKEKQSRSIESLNLTKSAGTTQSLEVFDIDMGGGGIGVEAKYAGTGGSFKYEAPNGQWGTKRMNAEESLSSRSAEVGQEKRETFSYSTQLSQMYHQLDSYHLGTNRALFFITSRPHTVESPHTFVNGPRELEGIQEFFFVVARPKDTDPVCVEAYLETGHVKFGLGEPTTVEVPDSEISTVWSDAYHAAERGDDDETTVYDAADKVWEAKALYPGYKIKSASLSLGKPDIYINDSGAPNLIEVPPYISFQNTDLIKVSGRVRSWFENVDFGGDNIGRVSQPFTVDIVLVKIERVDKNNDTLFITGRNLCCCGRPNIVRATKDGIVYEKALPRKQSRARRSTTGDMSIGMANRLRNEIADAIVDSRTDVERRYQRPIRIAQTDFAARALITELAEPSNMRVKDLEHMPDALKRKLPWMNPDARLSDLIQMPFRMQKDVFGLSDEEVIALRNYVSGLNYKPKDPKEAWLSRPELDRLSRKPDTKAGVPEGEKNRE